MQSVLSQAVLNLANKYIDNLQAGLSLGLGGGDVTLSNLTLKLDAVQPFIPPHLVLTKGAIQHLAVHIPWAAILTKPVKVTLQHIQVHVETSSLERRKGQEGIPVQEQEHKEQVSGASGWIQSFLTKVLSNVTVEIAHLDIVYRDKDVVSTLHVDSLKVFSCSPAWNQEFSVGWNAFIF